MMSPQMIKHYVINKLEDECLKYNEFTPKYGDYTESLSPIFPDFGLKHYEYVELEYDNKTTFINNFQQKLHSKNLYIVLKEIERMKQKQHSEEDVERDLRNYGRSSGFSCYNGYVEGDVSLGESVNAITDMCKNYNRWRKVRKQMIKTLQEYETRYTHCQTEKRKVSNMIPDKNPFTEFLQQINWFEIVLLHIDELADITL